MPEELRPQPARRLQLAPAIGTAPVSGPRHRWGAAWCAAAVLACAIVAPGSAVAGTVGADGAQAGAGSRQGANDTDAAEQAARDAQAAATGDPAALDRLMSSAEAGAVQAQFRLGVLYKDGKGVPRDMARYALWMRKAAEQGLAAAQVRLIGLYEEGVGVAKDPGQAAQWALRAAEQGELAGQVALVTDYYYGRGVPRNLVEAIKWQAVLEQSGYATPGDEFSRALEDSAGPVQAAQGRALAREWLQAYRARK